MKLDPELRLQILEKVGIYSQRFSILEPIILLTTKEVLDVIKEVSGDHWKIGSFERQQFYKESKNTYAFITTSERRPYCNFILTKGVIKPDGSVWILDK